MTNHRINNGRDAAGNITRVLLTVLMALAITGVATAQDQDNVNVKFRGGIGVVPVTGVNAATGAINLNVVRGVNPGGPWRIAALEGDVTTDGHIKISGRGLLLASGNGIGTNAGQTVHATLFCGSGTTITSHDSPAVALATNGDFTIEGFLSSTPPVPCTSPVLLIRNTVGVWFAAGIPKVEAEQN